MSSSTPQSLWPSIPDPLTMFARGINHLLRQEPWAASQLAPHTGKTLEFVLSPMTIKLALDADGWVHPALNDTVAVRIELPLSSLPQVLVDGPRAALRSVKLEGDAEFAQAVLDVVQNLKWEFEEDLSRYIGDIAARRVAQGAREFAGQVRRANRNMAESMAEYLLDEKEELVRPCDLEDFGAHVRTLRDDLARLEKRLDRLTQI